MRVWLIFASSLTILFAWSPEAHADLKVDGKWRQSALREDFNVVQWLDASCGPPPKSSTSGGGESIDLKAEGDELVFIGGGRVYRTNACYDPMPGLQRASHSRDGKTWRTRCATPPSDARKVVLNTLIVATSDTHIEIVETGRYEMSLEGGKCVADVKRTRSFDATSDAIPAAETSAPAPVKSAATTPSEGAAPPRPALCGIVGEGQKLEVRPSQKLLRPGESFRLRGVVLDAKGCETKTGAVFKVAAEGAGKGVRVDTLGNITVAKDAAEGTIEIVASAGGKETRVSVEIVSAARYDELLGARGLNAAGENDEAATVAIASQSLGTEESSVEDRSRQRRLSFLVIIGVALAGLLVAALFVFRRNRRATALLGEAEERHGERVREVLERRRQREAEHAAQLRAHQESVVAATHASTRDVASGPSPLSRADLVCPKCGREMDPDCLFCPHDGTPVVAARAPTGQRRSGGGVCPVCNTVFGNEVTRCPKDKQPLIPYPVQALAQRSEAQRGKICPSCGERFDGAADFCGKDGTQLVLLN